MNSGFLLELVLVSHSQEDIGMNFSDPRRGATPRVENYNLKQTWQPQKEIFYWFLTLPILPPA